MKLEVGDCIEHADDELFVCQILAVRSSGYSWRYVLREKRLLPHPSEPSETYRSEHDIDPYFDQGWTRIHCAQLSGTRR